MLSTAKKHHAYLSILCLTTAISLLLMHAPLVFAETQQSEAAYPSTPEGVVEALVKADFDGTTNYHIGDMKIRAKYAKPGTRYDETGDWQGIVAGYEVKKIKQTATKATVEVLYKRVGWIVAMHKGLDWERVDDKQIFELEFKNSFWKISSPENMPPHISTKTAIKVLSPGNPNYKPKTITDKMEARDICLLKKVDAGHSVTAALSANDCGLPYEKLLPSYPDTPEGVVEAAKRADFDGTANQEIGDFKKRLDYTIEQVDIGSEGYYIASDYSINKLAQEADQATVQVHYKIIGSLGFDSVDEEQKEVNVIASLKLRNGFWKIVGDPGGAVISTKTAIKILKHWMSSRYATNPTVMKQNLNVLIKMNAEYSGDAK